MIRTLCVIAVLALLSVGCKKGTTEQTTPTPGVEPVEAPAEQSQYVGISAFLRGLIDLPHERFAVVCAEVGGTLGTETEGFLTCMDGVSGFAIKFEEDGTTIGSSVLVPPEDGQPLANALIDELGEPTFSEGASAQWDLPGFVVVFGPVGNIAYITIMEKL